MAQLRRQSRDHEPQRILDPQPQIAEKGWRGGALPEIASRSFIKSQELSGPIFDSNAECGAGI
jgi:hypothetical protein